MTTPASGSGDDSRPVVVDDRDMTPAYVRVLVVWAVVLLSLFLFSRHFS